MISYFWPRVWLTLGAAQASFFGVALVFRDIYYSWNFINLRIPEPPLYANVAAVFLIIIAIWTLYVAYKMQPELWIIPAGSSVGRGIYFFIALLGYLFKTNEFLYVVIGVTDLFFSILLGRIALQLKNAANKY